MMRVPGTAAIEAAERRHCQAVADMRAASRRCVEAARAALTRPSTLGLAALAGMACGMRGSPPAGAKAVPPTGTFAVLLAFMLRKALQHGTDAYLRRSRLTR